MGGMYLVPALHTFIGIHVMLWQFSGVFSLPPAWAHLVRVEKKNGRGKSQRSFLTHYYPAR